MEAVDVAGEGPDVRGQVLAEPDGLGALAVRVPREDGVAVALGPVEERRRRGSRSPAASSSQASLTQSRMAVCTWSFRLRPA